MPLNLNTPNNLENEVATETIRKVNLVLATMASLSTVSIGWYFTASSTYSAPALYAALLLTFIGWLGVAMSYRVNAKYLAMVMIFSVQAVAAYGVFSFGSIRAASSVIFLATVVAAGILLSKRALIATLLIALGSLGAVNVAEIQGHIQPHNLQVNVITWLTHAWVLTAAASLVYYSRHRTRQAFNKQSQALEENKRLTLERDRNLAHFTRIFRTSPCPMLAQSLDTGKIVDLNPAFERTYGYERQALMGRSDRVLWAQPHQRESYLAELDAAKRVENREVRGRRSDGSEFDALISSELGAESEGSLVITIITDMTVQNQAITQLRRSEERFSKAFNFSPLRLVITRLCDDTVIEINHTNPHDDLADRQRFKGLPASQAVPWFSPPDRAVFLEYLRANGRVHAHETSLNLPEGGAIQAKVWAEPIDIDEQPCLLTCIVDTSQEKRREMLLHNIASGMTGQTAQAFFETLTQHMSNALDADMVLIGELSSAHTVHTLSASKQGHAVAPFSFFIAENPVENHLHQRGPVVLDAAAHGNEVWQALDPDTCHRTCISQALHGTEGTPIGLLMALWRNPTQPTADTLALMSIFASRASAEMLRLRSEREIDRLNSTLEQRVQQRTAELQKLNAELDSFAYSISHDLKSPLRAIDGFTQLLNERLQDRLSPTEQQLMERILGATHRMATLMADLLALARISQLPMRREWTHLSELVEEVIHAQARASDRPGLRWQIEPGVWDHVDRELTRTLLEGLIENALKYTRDQPHPLIGFGQVPQAQKTHGEAKVFFLRDNGVGFSMAHADKLFKPFQRLHMPDAGFEGTGIGLATARRIVERHGGAIEGTGQVGIGAEFRFSLAAPLSLMHGTPNQSRP